LVAILRILLTDEQIADDVSIASLAKRTESFSGSDLKRESLLTDAVLVNSCVSSIDLCVAAALDAVKEHAKLPWSVPRGVSPDDPSTSILHNAHNGGLLNSNETDTVEVLLPSGQSKLPHVSASELLESSTSGSDVEETESDPIRVLRMVHFEKALKEITPSASEQMGTLADLRKWNEEFGEGGRKRGKRIWGGKFGFIVKGGVQPEEGRVQRP
jgi:SpoVK/Ycf46/Vps4 family AAA+-type ATPase